MFVKTNFQLLKLKFHVYNFKQAWISTHVINYISRDFDNTKIVLYKLFVWYLIAKAACVNAALVANTSNNNTVEKATAKKHY